MSFDSVHDTQAAYRILLDCMARPGRVGNLAALRDRIGLESSLNPGLLLLALTLLDGETTVSVPREGVPEPEAAALAGMEVFLARICSCRIEDPGRAAFLFLPRIPQGPGIGSSSTGAPESGRAAQAVEGAFRGSFLEPHLGATVLAEVETLSPAPPEGAAGAGPACSWILEGPGVDGRSALACGPGDAEFLGPILAARGRACSEFPLGVDLVILDREGRVVCLPRTTSVRGS